MFAMYDPSHIPILLPQPTLDTAGIHCYSWFGVPAVKQDFAVVGPGTVVVIATAPSNPSRRLSEILT